MPITDLRHGSPLAQFTDLWQRYGHLVILAGLAVTVAFMLGTLLYARHKGRNAVAAWMMRLSWVATFVLNLNSMWRLMTVDMEVPGEVAIFAFLFADSWLITSMMDATEAYDRTTERDADGKVTRPGDPGKHGRTVWLVAAVVGFAAASGSHNLPEGVLRFGSYMGVALMFWNRLTSQGVTRQRTRWVWTPRWVLLTIGAIEPGEEDVREVSRERQVALLARLALRVHGVVPAGKARRKRAGRRLARLLPAAPADVIAEVQRRVSVGKRAVELTRPEAAALVAERDEMAARVAELAGELDETTRRLAAAESARDAMARGRQAAERTAEQSMADQQTAVREERERRAAAEAAAAEAREECRRALAQASAAAAHAEAAEASAAAARREAERERQLAADAAVRAADAEATAAAARRELAAVRAAVRAQPPAADTGGSTGGSPAGRGEPPAADTGGSGGGSRVTAGGGSPADAGGKQRRKWPETVALYRKITAENPGKTETEIAKLMKIEDRTLRDAKRKYSDMVNEKGESVAEALVAAAAESLGNGKVLAFAR